MNLYQVNREERHFGFLFMSSLISYAEFRSEIFDLLNSRLELHLNDQVFDIYAEPAIFRDSWRSLGDPRRYSKTLNDERRKMLDKMLTALGVEDCSLIDQHPMFWTGVSDKRKLWYPGKWNREDMLAVEKERSLDKEGLLRRCRWLCNAKPDVMIESGDEVLFVEMKVESGMGRGRDGYRQRDVQQYIIAVGASVFGWREGAVKKITLSRRGDPKEPAGSSITWKEVIDAFLRTRPRPDLGAEMIERHLLRMLKDSSASPGSRKNPPGVQQSQP
jgi:hypothetical protein